MPVGCDSWTFFNYGLTVQRNGVCWKRNFWRKTHKANTTMCKNIYTMPEKRDFYGSTDEIRSFLTVFISSTILTDRVCKSYEKYKNKIILYIRNLCPRNGVRGFRVISFLNHENPFDTIYCLKIHCMAFKFKSVIANSTKRTRFEAARKKSPSVFLNWTLLLKTTVLKSSELRSKFYNPK